jgi:cytochrome c peroxidase
MRRMFRLFLLLVLVWGATQAAAQALPDPVTDADYRAADPKVAQLGQLLFFDKILSGNRNISCATCHVPALATTDRLSLGLGEGGEGTGPSRHAGTANLPVRRLARNVPALFNLGAREFTALFADGRVEADPSRPSGLRTPLDESLVRGFGSVLEAQVVFPILSPDEMAGQGAENDIALAVSRGRISVRGGALDLVTARVAAIPAYRDGFARAFPEIAAGRDIRFADLAQAIAAFVATEWRSDGSPFDAMLRGGVPLEGAARAGMGLFYGPARCSECHAGPFQTDHRFHAMGEPQIGPGKPRADEPDRRDLGRMRVTGRAEDAYAFRTPSLRNVAETGPWGHAGAWTGLSAFLAHHAAPSAGLEDYRIGMARLPDLPGAEDGAVMADPAARAEIAAAARSAPHVTLSVDEVDRIRVFLETLSDPVALHGRQGVPERVPSGLPVD